MPRPSLTYAIQLARRLHEEGQFSVLSRKLQYVAVYRENGKTGSLIPQKLATVTEQVVDPAPYLHAEIQKRRAIKIRFVAVDLPEDVRNSVPTLAVMEGPDRAVVLFQRDATYCIRRFGRVKELIHLYDGSFVTSDTSGVALSEAISAAMRLSTPSLEHASDPLHPEHFCYYCALELLLWWGKPSGDIRQRLTNMHAAKTPEYIMACSFRVPLAVIQRFFECSQYVRISHELNTTRV